MFNSIISLFLHTKKTIVIKSCVNELIFSCCMQMACELQGTFKKNLELLLHGLFFQLKK
jgi:hypothetical protein